MDELARNHIANRLRAARGRRAAALQDIEQFLHEAQEDREGDWHNLATWVAQGATAKGQIDAYLTALAAADSSAADPKPPKE
jgi:hypothetical protein